MNSTVVFAMKGEKKMKDPQWWNWFARVKIFVRQKQVGEPVNPQVNEESLEDPR